MNWRLLTAINAVIALITLSSVIYIASRPRGEHGHARARSSSKKEQEQANEREAKARIEALTDLSQARVDDLGAVPAAELTHLMDRATPEQLAALAAKFNDAPTDARTFGGMAVFFQAWTELAPNAALTGAFQLQDVAMRKLAATAVVNSVSPSTAPELIAYLTEHPDKDLLSECKNKFLDPLIASWSSLDPEAAANFMDSLGDTKNSLKSTARENIAYNWGTLDPSAALEWVRNQGDKDYINSDPLYDDVIRGWCRANLPEASAYVAQHLDEPNGPGAASSVVAAMFERDPDQATSWLSNMPSGQSKSDAETTIAQIWAEKDPTAASRWVAALPVNEQSDVAGTITRTWMENNWPEASRWINSLTGDVRDSALAAAMGRQDATREDSLSLALSIQNDEMRHDRIERVIRSWTYSDSDAAEAWVKNSLLSPDERQHLLSVIAEMRKDLTEANAEQ